MTQANNSTDNLTPAPTPLVVHQTAESFSGATGYSLEMIRAHGITRLDMSPEMNGCLDVHILQVPVYREADGHTYWRDRAGEWMAAPTHTDGTPDMHAAGYVEDFEIEAPEAAELAEWLAAVQEGA